MLAGWGAEDLQDPIGGVAGVGSVLVGSNGLTGNPRDGGELNHRGAIDDLRETTRTLSSRLLIIRIRMIFGFVIHLYGRRFTTALGRMIFRCCTDIASTLQTGAALGEDHLTGYHHGCQGKAKRQPIVIFVLHLFTHYAQSVLLYVAKHQDVRKKNDNTVVLRKEGLYAR